MTPNLHFNFQTQRVLNIIAPQPDDGIVPNFVGRWEPMGRPYTNIFKILTHELQAWEQIHVVPILNSDILVSRTQALLWPYLSNQLMDSHQILTLPYHEIMIFFFSQTYQTYYTSF